MWLDDFRRRVAADPERTAVVTGGRRVSYRALWEQSHAAGEADFGGVPGRRCLVTDTGHLACLERVIGAWIVGKVPLVIPADTPAEAQGYLRALIARERPEPGDPEQREGLLLTTAGSTGRPKVAALSQGVLVKILATMGDWYGQPEDTEALVPTAMFRSRALISNSLMGLSRGWTLHYFPVGTPGSVLQAYIRAAGIHVLNGPPSFFRMFFRYGSGQPFPSVRHVAVGGEPVPWPVVEGIHAAFPEARTYITYGMTEAGVRIASIPARDSRARGGACGIPLPHFELRIAPVADLPPPVGELQLRGGTNFLGYLQEDGSHAGLDAEGFLHTGDLVRLDPDGCLHHLGRQGGLVKVGGLVANPREVEQVLLTLPGIADALCWAEPHELLGFTIAAQVVPLDGQRLDADALRRECRTRLERHKVPRSVTIVDRLPETAAGKRGLMPAPAP